MRAFLLLSAVLAMAAALLISHKNAPLTRPEPRLAALSAPALGASFEPNWGQSDSEALFLARGGDLSSFFSRDGLTVSMLSGNGTSFAVRMRLLGGDPDVTIRGDEARPGRSNYFLGDDPAAWRRNVPHFGRVRYEQLYPGVDLVYYRNDEGLLEYDFEVEAKGDPAPIAFTFDGADEVKIAPSGDLLVQVGDESLVHRRPEAYQLEGSRRTPVASSYVLESDHRVRFSLGEYDASRPLVIDPVFDTNFSIGGTSQDDNPSVFMGEDGRIYLAVETNSPDFPTTLGARDRSHNSVDEDVRTNDIAVAAITSDGRFFEFSTFIGGAAEDKPEGFGRRIEVDSRGRIVVVGWTESPDFPSTAGAVQEAAQGERDIVAFMLNPGGDQLLYSTRIGGAGNDLYPSLAIGSDDDVYIAAQTDSDDIPTTANAIDRTLNGGFDAYVARLRMDGGGMSDLLYASYLGGSGDDEHASMALGGGDVVHLAGETSSGNFPVTAGAFDPSFNGGAAGGSDPGDDIFVCKLSPLEGDATTLVYSTYIGGSGEDDFDGRSPGIVVDPGGDIWFTGETITRPNGPNPFPTTPDAFDRTLDLGVDGNDDDLVLVRLRPAGGGPSDLIYSTYYGGTGDDNQGTIALDANGVVYLAGETEGLDLPTVDALQEENAGGEDLFLAAFTQGGRTLAYASYLGGPGDDGEANLFVNGDGVLLASEGASTNSARQVFVDKFVDFGFLRGVSTLATVSAADFGRRVAGESIVSGFGSGLASGTLAAVELPLPTDLGGTTVEIVDSAGVSRLAELFFVSAGQINYFLPGGLPLGLATVTARLDGAVIARGTVDVRQVAPALFALPGQTTAAGSFLRIAADGVRTQQFVFDAQSQPVAIALGPEGEQVFLLLFGTGVRNFSGAVEATIGGVAIPVLGAVAQGAFVGLDQVNLGPIPRSLIGSGEVEIILTVDGVEAAAVTVVIG